METPYLDKEIEYLESLKKAGEISFYSSKKLEEYKEAKKQLSLCSVTQQSKLLRDYSEYLDTYKGFLHGRDRTEIAEKWLSRNSE